jgi:hypothetical protein
LEGKAGHPPLPPLGFFKNIIFEEKKEIRQKVIIFESF